MICNDVKNNNGENAFHYAARYGKINHLRYFVEKDPEIVNSKTDMGWNALHFSVAYGTGLGNLMGQFSIPWDSHPIQWDGMGIGWSFSNSLSHEQ